MKKLSLLLTFLFVFQSQEGWVLNNNIEINTINEAIEEQGYEMDEWQVVYLEEVTANSFKSFKKTLLKSFAVNMEETKQLEKYIFTDKKMDNTMSFELRALVSKQQNNQNVQLQIILSGTNWDETEQNYYKDLTKFLQDRHELKLSRIFTCAKLNDSGIMNDGFSVNNLMEKLNVIHKVEQIDTIEKSTYEKNIYGYSPLFSNELNINDEAVNFQLAVRNATNKKKHVIIGTPIILDEY